MYPVDCDNCDWKNYFDDCLIAGHDVPLPTLVYTTTPEECIHLAPVPEDVLSEVEEEVLVESTKIVQECDENLFPNGCNAPCNFVSSYAECLAIGELDPAKKASAYNYMFVPALDPENSVCNA